MSKQENFDPMSEGASTENGWAEHIGGRIQRVLEDMSLEELVNIANGSNTSITVLKTLAKNPDEVVRRSVAFNPNISDELIKQLGQDPVDNVRAFLASNPVVLYIPGIVEQLLADKSLVVRVFLAENNGLTKDHIWILERLSNDNSEFVAQKAKDRLTDLQAA